MNWNEVIALATVVSMLAFVASALFVAQQLRALEKNRYLEISSDLYSTWQSEDFMEAQLWLIHRLQETTWPDFVAAHRADYGEQAFHRVGSFYDRVGTLVRLGLIEEREILSTLGPYAIAVWGKIRPLVREARRAENSILFQDFERMLPTCYECYVPNLAPGSAVVPVSGDMPPAPLRAEQSFLEQRAEDEVPRISVRALHRKLRRVVVLDVRKAPDETTLPGALLMAPHTVPARLGELPPGKEIVAFCA